jgi:arylformamidase
MKILDISPPVAPGIAVFPGDVSYTRDVSMDMAKGQHLGLSSIRTTLHLGAHADATNHYNVQGQGIEARPLEPYLGLCQVVEIPMRYGERLKPEDLGVTLIQAPRVLFKTSTFNDPNRWVDDFAALSPELIEFLAKRKVLLVGIDTPSVDPADCKTLDSHQALFRTGMAVLEGLWLKDITPGMYTLVALPLRLVGADASPVRAVLVQEERVSSRLLDA